MLNQVVLVGRLTGNPEIKNLENDKKVTSVNIAVQRSFKNADGVYEADFIRCILWNSIASNTVEYCKKGDIVGIKGRIQTTSYLEDDGTKKYSTDVVVEKISFLSSSSKTTKNNHECKYCGKDNNSPDSDVLCEDCRELFGHTFYSEL